MILVIARCWAGQVQSWDLDTDDGGFVEEGDLEQWAWGAVLHGAGSGWDSPTAWSTGLDGDYLNDSTDTLQLPLSSIAGLSQPMLRFQHWYELGAGDAAWIEIDTGDGWTRAAPTYGYPAGEVWAGSSGGWEEVVVDLQGLGDSPRFRWVFAADTSGTGAGWTLDAVQLHDGDVASPRVEHLADLPDTDDLIGPYLVSVAADDDVEIESVTLWWTAAGEEIAAPMERGEDELWTAGIQGQPADTTVSYRVSATDGVNTSELPTTGSMSFRVRLPAPTDLAGPEGRIVATEAHLTWSAPLSLHEVLSYEVLRGGVVVQEALQTEADVALSVFDDTFTVRAVYEAGTGDESDPLELDALVPELTSVVPAAAWPGETLKIVLSGHNLLLVEGDVSVGLGDGISVDAIEVHDVDSVELAVTLADDARTGDRDVALTTSDYELSLSDAFAVGDAEERPRLTSIEPDFLRQGASGRLVLSVVGDLAGEPEAEFGEGVVVESVEIDGDELYADVVVANDAPIGDHEVLLDDGVRIFDGVELTIRDTTREQPGTCGTGAPAWLALAGLAALGRRFPR